MLRMTFLVVSLTMLAGGAYAAQSAFDIQHQAYAGPPGAEKLQSAPNDTVRVANR
ncbi:MAG: hypothetical protein R3E14_00390 [Erythrobacter sp.]